MRSIPIKRGRLGEIPELLRKPNVLRLIPRLDAPVSLLELTSDALVATWDQWSAEADFFAGEKFGGPAFSDGHDQSPDSFREHSASLIGKEPKLKSEAACRSQGTAQAEALKRPSKG